MVAYRFRTIATELTPAEELEVAMPDAYKISAMLATAKAAGRKSLTDGQQMARAIMESEIKQKIESGRVQREYYGEEEKDYDGY
jgi:hypothetical protein